MHGVYLNDDLRDYGIRLLPLASLNSVTLLGAETVGRAYGGGMLKIEPREADLLPVPSADLVREHKEALVGLRQKVAARLRAGRLADAVAQVDDILLTRGLGLGAGDLAAIRTDRTDLTARRLARGREADRGE